jgi:hypothetical protein
MRCIIAALRACLVSQAGARALFEPSAFSVISYAAHMSLDTLLYAVRLFASSAVSTSLHYHNAAWCLRRYGLTRDGAFVCEVCFQRVVL